MRKILDEKLDYLRNKFELLKNDNFDIVELARKNNISVGNSHLLHDDGFLAICNEKNKHSVVIGVSNDYHLYLKRYIIAYALGLYFTKCDEEGCFIDKIKLDIDNIDLDIDYFASSLLVPMESFYSRYQHLKQCFLSDSIIDERLSKIYHVPLNVIRARRTEADQISVQFERSKVLVKNKY